MFTHDWWYLQTVEHFHHPLALTLYFTWYGLVHNQVSYGSEEIGLDETRGFLANTPINKTGRRIPVYSYIHEVPTAYPLITVRHRAIYTNLKLVRLFEYIFQELLWMVLFPIGWNALTQSHHVRINGSRIHISVIVITKRTILNLSFIITKSFTKVHRTKGISDENTRFLEHNL